MRNFKKRLVYINSIVYDSVVFVRAVSLFDKRIKFLNNVRMHTSLTVYFGKNNTVDKENSRFYSYVPDEGQPYD